MDSRSAFQEKIGHFLVKNDVTAAVRNRIWWSLFDFFVSLLCKIILSKFEVILLSRSRVWTWAVHFTTKFGHLIVKNDVTMAVRKQFSFYFCKNQLFICRRLFWRSLKWFWQVKHQISFPFWFKCIFSWLSNDVHLCDCFCLTPVTLIILWWCGSIVISNNGAQLGFICTRS